MSTHKPPARKIYDISVLIQPGMPIYPGDPPVTISQHYAKSLGDPVNVATFCLGAHTGTHVDAPRHLDDNWPSLSELDLEIFIGPATVFELDVVEAITSRDLAGLRWEGVKRALFKTRNSQLWHGEFREDSVYLAADAARYMVEHTDVRLVGIDYLSIERFGDSTLDVHRELLSRQVVILEGLDLSTVPPGEYELVCLPLKIMSDDGAVARALLIKG